MLYRSCCQELLNKHVYLALFSKRLFDVWRSQRRNMVRNGRHNAGSDDSCSSRSSQLFAFGARQVVWRLASDACPALMHVIPVRGPRVPILMLRVGANRPRRQVCLRHVCLRYVCLRHVSYTVLYCRNHYLVYKEHIPYKT